MIPKRSGRGTGTAVVATIATLFALMLATPAVASAGTTEETPTIVYSEMYLRLMALVPWGWASNACELVRGSERRHWCLYDRVRPGVLVSRWIFRSSAMDRRSLVADRVVARTQPLRRRQLVRRTMVAPLHRLD